MTVGATPPDEPYHESTDYSWTEKAFEMLERSDLQGEVVISREGVVLPVTRDERVGVIAGGRGWW